MLRLEMYGFLRIGYLLMFFEMKTREVVALYHIIYLIYFYDIYVTCKKCYQNKFDFLISNYIENSTSYKLVQLFLFIH